MDTTNVTFLTRKPSGSGYVYRLDGRGPWRSEYNTDRLLGNGVYAVLEGGIRVGEWVQETLCHECR